LDFEVIPYMLVKKTQKSSAALQTMGMANGILWEPISHPVISLTHATQQI
jgi:hypothetical protein